MKKIFVFALLITSFLIVSAQKKLIVTTLDMNHYPVDSVEIFDRSKNLLKLTDTFRLVLEVPDTTLFLIFRYKGFEKVENVKDVDSVNVIFPFFGYDDYSAVDDVVVTALVVKKKGFWRIKSKTRGVFLSREFSDAEVGAADIDYEFEDFSEEATIQPHPGLLTAGEVNDFAKWKLWQDITANQLKDFISVWHIYPQNRITVQVSDTNNLPIVNAQVNLFDAQNNLIWTARTDNTGKAELWYDIFDTTSGKMPKGLHISVLYNEQTYNLKKVKGFYKGINRLELPVSTVYPDTVDVAFVIDVTGSMSDELEFLKVEISDIINKVKLNYPNLVYRVGIVLYKDFGDDFVCKSFDFTTNTNSAISFMNNYYAGGGGDYPEAVHVALDTTVNKLSWSENGRTKIAFLVLDAPPHEEKNVVENLDNSIKIAAQKGIRIVPLSASGIDKSTEYLLRSMALATNGTYTFLTDDSGIGGSHIKPTTDKYDVEPMHDLMIKIIKKYIEVPAKNPQKFLNKNKDVKDTTVVGYDTVYTDSVKNPVDTTNTDTLQNTDSLVNVVDFKDVIRFYPNPTHGHLTVEVLSDIKEFYLADLTGKLLNRYEVNFGQRVYDLELYDYVNGIYFILFFKDNRWYSGKVILVR